MPTVTVKMSAEQFARLERIARERRIPKATVLRESFDRVAGQPVPGSMCELIGDLIGSVKGPGDLTSNPKYMEHFGKDGSARRAAWSRLRKEAPVRRKKAA